MESKPKSLKSVFPEKIIIQEFGLPEPKSGKSRVVSSWVGQGLKHFEISERRYFLEGDLLDFFWKKYKENG